MINPSLNFVYGQEKLGTRFAGNITAVNTQFIGSTLAPNGSVYIAPQQARYVGKYTLTPNNDIGTITLIGTQMTATPEYRYVGGILAPNGFIYMSPHNAYLPLKVNPSTDTTTTFGTSDTLAGKYVGSILARNGMIYAIPSAKGNFMMINPTNDTTALFGTISGTTFKYHGGVMGNDGMIYCVPSTNNRICKLDPTTSGITYVGSALTGTTYKYVGGALATTGKIYMVPVNATNVLEFDPVAGTTKLVGPSLGTGQYKWNGAVLAPNGKIYCALEYEQRVLEIDPFATNDIDKVHLIGNTYTPNNLDKCATGTLLDDGKIYFFPESANAVVRVQGVSTPNLLGNDIYIPSNLSTLATSNYNKYYNHY